MGCIKPVHDDDVMLTGCCARLCGVLERLNHLIFRQGAAFFLVKMQWSNTSNMCVHAPPCRSASHSVCYCRCKHMLSAKFVSSGHADKLHLKLCTQSDCLHKLVRMLDEHCTSPTTVTLKQDYMVCCFQRVHVCHTVLPHSTSTVAVHAHKSCFASFAINSRQGQGRCAACCHHGKCRTAHWDGRRQTHADVT